MARIAARPSFSPPRPDSAPLLGAHAAFWVAWPLPRGTICSLDGHPCSPMKRARATAIGSRAPSSRIAPTSVLATPFRNPGELNVADVAMKLDVASYLPDDLLVKVDIATMASSLEESFSISRLSNRRIRSTTSP